MHIYKCLIDMKEVKKKNNKNYNNNEICTTVSL